MHKLTERQAKLLQIVIKLYLEGVKEISSLFLSSLNILPISSATIRNELSILTKEGYLMKTHYAAGRRPTLKAIHYYINNLYTNKSTYLVPTIDIPRFKSCLKFLSASLKGLSQKYNVATFATHKYGTSLYNIKFLIDAGAKILSFEQDKNKYKYFLAFMNILEDTKKLRLSLTKTFSTYQIQNIALNYLYESSSEIPHILIAFLPYKCRRTEYIGMIGYLNYTLIQGIQDLWQILTKLRSFTPT